MCARAGAAALRMVLVAAAATLATAAGAQNRFGDVPRGSGTAGTAGLAGAAGPAGPAQGTSRPAPAATPAAATDPFARLEAHERQDHGVAPPAALHAGPMHGPTPTAMPGGRLVTTRALVELLRGGSAEGRPLVFDVLGGTEQLPGALMAVPAHQAGGFDDGVQREFGRFLQQVTQGRQDRPLVFYCASTQCWMSYNAALRAIRLGYSQVLWYRGGIEAWKAAGQPLQAATAQAQATR